MGGLLFSRSGEFFLRRKGMRDRQDIWLMYFVCRDPMLHKVGETLKENDVPNVFVQGNVHVRNAALNKFRNDEKVCVLPFMCCKMPLQVSTYNQFGSKFRSAL